MDRPRHANSFINTRIDRFYTSQPITPHVSENSIVAYPHSDHDIILLTLDLDHQPRGSGYWHFNNTLLDDAIFGIEIQEFWTQWRTEKTRFPSPLEWWEAAKQNFKRIAIKRSTKLWKLAGMERNKLERDLPYLKQKATTGTPADVGQYLLAKQQLSDLEQRDLEAVKIRAKARFTEEGEKSTRYFYSLEKKKQADRSIQTLTKDNLDTVTLLVTFYLRHVPSIKNFTPPKQLILTRNDLSSIFLFLSYPPPTSNHVNFLSPPLNLNML